MIDPSSEAEPAARAGWKPWVGLAARLGLAAVWIIAAWKKMDLAQTTRDTRNFELGFGKDHPVPDWVNVAIGHSLPFVEMGLGVLILIGLFTRFAAIVSALLMTAFIIGIASAWARGLTIECGCFGGGGQVAPEDTVYGRRILEDIGFLAMALWLVKFPRTRFSADRGLGLVAPD